MIKSPFSRRGFLFKNKINCRDQQREADQMVGGKSRIFEDDRWEDDKNGKRDDFLQNF